MSQKLLNACARMQNAYPPEVIKAANEVLKSLKAVDEAPLDIRPQHQYTAALIGLVDSMLTEMERRTQLWHESSNKVSEFKSNAELANRAAADSAKSAQTAHALLKETQAHYRETLRRTDQMRLDAMRLFGGDDMPLPVFESLHSKRLEYKNSMAERVYFTEWYNENQRKPGTNHGYAALELILDTRPHTSGGMVPHPYGVDIVSQRDVHVATAVVQWLGTACGGAFVRRCERMISKLESEMREERLAEWKRQREAEKGTVESMRRAPDNENEAEED